MTGSRSDGIGRWASHGPIATLLGIAGGLAIFWMPEWTQLAQFQTGTCWGQPWRILTSHFAHFSARHLIYDLVAFAALGFLCERNWPRRTRAGLAIAMLTIPLAFQITTPELALYRGLSGLDSMLLVLLATRLHAESAFPSAPGKYLPLLAVFGFLAKTVFEVSTQQTLFVGQEALFEPVPVAHLLGGAIGWGIAVVPDSRAALA